MTDSSDFIRRYLAAAFLDTATLAPGEGLALIRKIDAADLPPQRLDELYDRWTRQFHRST